ncbi:MAG TPA: RagB/SusD family nutrient uptake outer membrane protein [Prolixibacteraceae bacterium]|nr:RagB/SusD family nutrient uptake outer membrane protein [Prolixibacteraceae bacterium]
MKVKVFNYLFIAAAMVFSLGSCDEAFLEVQPEGQFLSANYYADKDQAYAALVGVYDVLRKNSGGFENMISMMNAGSDDHYAGGGGASDGAGIQGFSNYTLNSTIMPGSFWNDYYQGIFRANTLLSKLPDITMDAALKARFTAETKALRAYYYFNLVIMFKNVPLLLEPLTATNMYDVTQATPVAVYTQIEKDLNEAIADLPSTVSASTEAGRLTKGAAQAILGKVYLYDKKPSLAAAQLALVNGTPGGTSQYGYRLLSSFSDLWVTSNKFNTESILEVSHSSAGNSDWGWWGSSSDEGNTLNVMVGPRSYSRPSGSTAEDIPSGWSFNVFTQEFYDAMKLDPRFGATVYDLKALKAAGKADYIGGYMDTGYFLNKFLPRRADVRTGGGAMELNYKQDTYAIRLADTYLLEAEALGGTGSRAQALLDAVRTRAGLPSVPVSMAAIKAERRMELAGEGFRFFDLVRWGDAASKLGSRGFVANKHEIFPIPYRELQGTKMVQNPGYN